MLMGRVYLFIGLLVIGGIGYWYVSSLQEKVAFLEIEKATLESNLVEQKKSYEYKLKQQKVVVKWKTKKVYIEKELKRESEDDPVRATVTPPPPPLPLPPAPSSPPQNNLCEARSL